MTKEEWLKVEVGDFLIEGKNWRKVLSVTRVSGKPGQKIGQVRTVVEVPSLQTRMSKGRTIIIYSTEDRGGTRYQLHRSK